jgi:IS30 family transposase
MGALAQGRDDSPDRRLFDRGHSSIQHILAESGGIRPAERRRSKLALTLSERKEISRGVVAGRSIRSIAASLVRAPSSISREIRPNGGPVGYRAAPADEAALDRARRPKVCKLVQNRALAHLVASKLCREWSPEQIAGWLKRTYADDETHQVLHGGTSIPLRHAREGRQQGYADRRYRPHQARAQATARTLPVADLGSRQRAGGPQTLYASHRHQGLLLRSAQSLAARIEREYERAVEAILPKGIDLSAYSQAELNALARRLNQRPRKTLNYETPAEKFHQSVASTG